MQQVSFLGQCLNACVHLKPCSMTAMLLAGQAASDKATSPFWVHPHILYFLFFVPHFHTDPHHYNSHFSAPPTSPSSFKYHTAHTTATTITNLADAAVGCRKVHAE